MGKTVTFSSGDNIGLFLILNGWKDDGSVAHWNESNTESPFGDAQKNNEKGIITTVDSLNPEIARGNDKMARHFISLWINNRDRTFLSGKDFMLCGIEDNIRPSGIDEDFNDCVIFVCPTVDGAIDITTNPGEDETPITTKKPSIKLCIEIKEPIKICQDLDCTMSIVDDICK